MKDASGVRRQMTEIGDRFLRRTSGEVVHLRALLAQLRAGDAAALREIEVVVHRIHGSGAMFGFEKLSDVAYECEALAMAGANDPAVVDRIEAALRTLEAHLAEAARSRGIEP